MNATDDIGDLMANFARDKSAIRDLPPPWNLSLVLEMLTKPPFEPLHTASLKYVTWKTVFLLALASGKRRSELHALTNRVIHHSVKWSKVTLVPETGFLAKTELVNRPACKSILTIPALSPIVEASDEPQRKLCPIRALKVYLQITKAKRGMKRKLFIAHKANFAGEIHANTISGWLRKVITLAHEDVPEETRTRLRIKAHSIRSVASSWAFQKNVSLQNIMDACSWSSHNTFTSYYLKDMALEEEGMFHLGPVVAAQQVV